MKAAVTTIAGPPEVIRIEEVPSPTIPNQYLRIQIKAFGLNRSEMFTRQGHSPNVSFPRIQGIECVGVVDEDPTGTYAKGQQVAAIMGGMGRDFDGGYAEFCSVPVKNVFPFTSQLDWSILGAIPEMFQTVSGSLHEALEIKAGETLLIRGGTSSIGILACQLAKSIGLHVISTTRNPKKVKFLKEQGADKVLIDSGEIQHSLKSVYPHGVNKVLELIGTVTLKDSLQCIAPKGTVCMTGILGNEWTLHEFTPMGDIPALGRLTVYMGEAENLSKDSLQEFINAIEKGDIKINIDKVYSLDDIVQAHRYMESNQAKGKLVVVI